MNSGRILKEQVCIEKMTALYCRAVHHTEQELCKECCQLLAYGKQRLERCLFGEAKPVCAKCPVHCYQEDMREKMIKVMRYSGPRMLYRHPVLAVRHFIDAVKSSTKGSKHEGK